MAKKKSEVVNAISEKIDEQAQTTLFLRLDEAKMLFKKSVDKLGFGKEADREELQNIVDFLMEKEGATKEMVWEECKTLRRSLIDHVVQTWAEKKP